MKMEMKFEEKQIITLIEKYYKSVELENVSVEIKAAKQLEGYGTAEHYTAKTTIKVKGEKEIDGLKIKYEKILTKKDLEEIFGHILAKNNYKLISIEIISSLKNNEEAQFNGLKIKVEPIQKITTTKR